MKSRINLLEQEKLEKEKNEHQVFEEILTEDIGFNENIAKENLKIIETFKKLVISELCAICDVFDKCFCRIYHTGSSYEKLRISHLNEFDLDLVLQIPRDIFTMIIECSGKNQPYAKCHLNYKKRHFSKKKIALCKNIQHTFCDEMGYLSTSKMRSWMQSILQRLRNKNPTLQDINNLTNYSLKQSGPATTVVMNVTSHNRTTSADKEISIDLVPVIEVPCSEWPKSANKTILSKFDINESDGCWFLVPKELVQNRKKKKHFKTSKRPTWYFRQCNQNKETDSLWRIHCPEVEKRILNDKGIVKPVIRILKKIRDAENGNWKMLSPYSLKTVVMWVVLENPDKEYWTTTYKMERVITVLNQLKIFLQIPEIPHLFYPSYNLIPKVTKAHAEIICNRLETIISDVKSDFHNLKKYVKGKV